MPRVVSFIVLLAIVLLIGMKFFEVMVLFIVPLFLAAVLVVIFKPVHLWILNKVNRRRRLAAVLTTLVIVLIVLLPTVALTLRALSEGMELYSKYAVAAAQGGEELNADVSEQAAIGGDQAPKDESDALDSLIAKVVGEVNKLFERFNLPLLKVDDVNATVRANLVSTVAPIAVGGLQILLGMVVGLAIMVIATYYFFADGPYMLIALMRMSPLDDNYERELLEKFSDISRSVVVATLLSAVAQGLLAGIGFYFVGLERIFFLTGTTIFLAMIPFVGAAAVWVPVCFVLYLHDDRPTAALVLAVYCGAIVSTADNVIKPYILHGQSNLHPLLALLSVIGGVQVLGPIGILVGPMLVAFLQALLNMLNKEIESMDFPAALQPVIEADEPSPPEPKAAAPAPQHLP
jgi:predicted PurR-regulated permease PerM